MNAVIFDWNGTLLADSQICWRVTNDSLRRLGKPEVSLARYRAHATVPIMKMYEAFGCTEGEMSDEIVSAWFHRYRTLAATARLRKGARETLGQLSSQACETVLLSNYVETEIATHMDRLGIRNHFDTLLANEAHATPMKKGKIGRLRAYLADKKMTCGVIVGDSEEEIAIAREQGLVSVAITDGVCSTARLRAARPDYLIGTLSALPPIVEKIFNKPERKTA